MKYHNISTPVQYIYIYEKQTLPMSTGKRNHSLYSPCLDRQTWRDKDFWGERGGGGSKRERERGGGGQRERERERGGGGGLRRQVRKYFVSIGARKDTSNLLRFFFFFFFSNNFFWMPFELKINIFYCYLLLNALWVENKYNLLLFVIKCSMS